MFVWWFISCKFLTPPLIFSSFLLEQTKSNSNPVIFWHHSKHSIHITLIQNRSYLRRNIYVTFLLFQSSAECEAWAWLSRSPTPTGSTETPATRRWAAVIVAETRQPHFHMHMQCDMLNTGRPQSPFLFLMWWLCDIVSAIPLCYCFSFADTAITERDKWEYKLSNYRMTRRICDQSTSRPMLKRWTGGRGWRPSWTAKWDQYIITNVLSETFWLQLFREELERVVGDSLRDSGADSVAGLISDVMNIRSGSECEAALGW